jgi:methylmalonyl-CoA mutase C-terminal domain/subunit
MVVERIVVGAGGQDDRARVVARRLRDAGHEVVFVGGHQTAAQLARAAVAEDATRVVVDAAAPAVEEVVRACAELGAGDVVVDPVV